MLTLPATKPPANADWQDEKASLESKARAYLDINCGFCHKPDGVANMSGLFLDASNKHELSLGIRKKVLAAPMASGGLMHDIEPGHPEKSALVYRMNATLLGVAMPQVGKLQVHKEGVARISEWIRSMEQ